MFMKKLNTIKARQYLSIALVSASLVLAACSSSDDDASDMGVADDAGVTNGDNGTGIAGGDNGGESVTGDNGDIAEPTSRVAIMAGADPLFESGQMERISITDGYVVNGTYEAVGSDIVVRTDGTSAYQLGRSNMENITKYSATDTSLFDYNFSIIDGDEGGNPHDIAFLNDNKAYVMRYNNQQMWIIDPSAESEDAFMIGELDLSAYEAGPPNATSAVIVGEKLFILMQRLTGQFDGTATQQSYIAVFNTTTDEEIDTMTDMEGGLMGIPLGTLNADDLRYNPTLGQLVVTGRGDINRQFRTDEPTDDPYQGGIQSIDPDTYEVSLILDDGTADSNQGFISQSLILNSTKGYVKFFQGFDPDTFIPSSSVHSFDPSTGIISEEFVSVMGMDVATMDIGSDGYLWLGSGGTTPGFTILDTADDSVIQSVATTFNPNSIVFISLP